ncbi:glutamate carboxypeptidase [Grosmannia clavigera kw1407]|uniref:Glutamate carboxypeptidase n=1 Tax=Grosmannia clavigera (strain kw1407 / UAMH 11150) TaxID=655863 RepID=F0XJB0_GROCL|nr:glutamate carboxypeptidase [Grosmannia clavigera kw1407]EFX02211.1 glutamate carboxypeptidase [Grosmannia clavigera kw1407]
MAPPSNGNGGGPYDPPIPTYEQAVSSHANVQHLSLGGALPSPSTFDPLSPMGEAYYAPEHESRSLLRRSHQRTSSTGTEPVAGSAGARSRARPSGYRPPTVETDDEDSTWSSSESEDGHDDDAHTEAAHVRREMLELDMEDPLSTDGRGQRGRSSIFGKTIGFSLPKWKWNWRWSMPRLQLRLPNGPQGSTGLGFGSRFGGRLAGFSPIHNGDGEVDLVDASTTTSPGANGGDASASSSARRCRCWPAFQPSNSAPSLIVFARIFVLALILGFIYLIFISDLFSSVSRRLGNQAFDPESVRMFIQSQVDPAYMKDMSKHLTSYAHMAGTEGDFAVALDVKNLFQQYGLESITVDEYYVYLNYPTANGRAVEIIGDDGTATWKAKLEEDDMGGETAGNQTYAFHGLSKSGDVHGPLVYANYGSREDFQKLHDSGIETKGAIALVRYYGTQPDRALKVKAAELAGFAGCLIYSDPMEDGFLRGTVAPDGPYMPADGVQRGSVSLMSWVVGDVLTPGWESKKKLPRMSPAASPGLVQIPSLPLAWRDAQVLLQHLRGAGVRVPQGWEGGVPDVDEWWTGNATGSPIVRLKNEQDEVTEQPIWNVYGRIEGIEQAAKKVILGNHRDAWTFGSADPHSGTVVMLQMARIFGDLLQRGWRPLRTIEFMSWDAEEYNLIGSTEYVENNLGALRSDALAYLNLDTAVTGQQLHVAGSPVFSKVLVQAMKRISDPNGNASLYDMWQRHGSYLEVLGAGSDYVAFQDIAGTSSLDLHFDGPENAMPLHSAYENFDWMERVGDPGFVYHGILGELIGLVLIELADRPVLPFDMAAYANALQIWVKELIAWVRDKSGENAARIDVVTLQEATGKVVSAVAEFEGWERSWEAEVLSGGGWEPSSVGRQREEYNSRMGMFETDLLDLAQDGGIPNRTQFRHILYGPSLWDSYEGDLFPAVRDAVNVADWALANRTVAKISNILRKAADNLVE